MVRRSGRKRRGFTMVEVLVATTILTGLAGGNGFQGVNDKAHQTVCFNNLRQMYLAFQLRATGGDPLPRAWFYPPDPPHPYRETYNLAKLMVAEGVDKRLFICPSSPPEIQDRGICYLYNDRLSERELDTLDRPAETWLMMDLNALTKNVPPAHHGGCNVLYCDGHVKWMPAEQLPSLLAQAVDYRPEGGAPPPPATGGGDDWE